MPGRFLKFRLASQLALRPWIMARCRRHVSIAIKALLRSALTDAVNDREVFMKGADASYAYEGHASYSASNL